MQQQQQQQQQQKQPPPPPTPSLWHSMTLPFSTPPTKQSSNGDYLPFPNITIVCHLDLSEENGFSHFKTLPEVLEKVSCGFMAPLPSSSYHATLLAGPRRRDLKKKGDGRKWEAILKEAKWGEIAGYLGGVEGGVGFCPGGLRVGKVVMRNGGVSVDLVGEECRDSGVRYAGDVKTRELRGELRELGGGKMESWERPWHITLGYGRGKSQGNMPPGVEKEVVRVVQEWFGRGYANRGRREIPFQAAELCLSPSMESFVPWNGGLPGEKEGGNPGKREGKEEGDEKGKEEEEKMGEAQTQKGDQEKEVKEIGTKRGRGRGQRKRGQKPRVQHLGP